MIQTDIPIWEFFLDFSLFEMIMFLVIQWSYIKQ
jgi:hypothetical protein